MENRAVFMEKSPAGKFEPVYCVIKRRRCVRFWLKATTSSPPVRIMMHASWARRHAFSPVFIRRIRIPLCGHTVYEVTTPDSEPVHEAAKGVRVEPQDGSRTPASADHPFCPLKHSKNVLALYFFERISVSRLSNRLVFYARFRPVNRQEIGSKFEN